MIAVVIDFAEKVGKFIDSTVTTREIVFDYYLNFIPWINGLLWPLFSLIAVIFFTSRMAKNSEIIPILSSGVSYWRFLVPFMISATFIASLLWYGSNYIIPKSTKIKNDFESKYIRNSLRTLSNDIHFFLNPDEKIYLRYFRKRDTSGQTFRLETFQDGKLARYLKATKIELKKPPNTWTLYNYEIREFHGMRDSILNAKGEKMDTTLNMTGEDFIKNLKLMENMTSSDLKSYIERERERGLGTAKAHTIELHRRTSDPATIIILTLIGVAIASRKTRGGIGLHLALGIILGSAFVILSRFTVTFSSNMSLPAYIGVWIPNMVFSLIAIYLIIKAQK